MKRGGVGVLVAVALAAGCNHRHSSAASTDGGGDAAAIAQPGPKSDCDRPSGNFLDLSTVEGYQAVLRGTWELCTNRGLFDLPQAGIYVGPDDHWVLLDLVEGRLVAQAPDGSNSGVLAFHPPAQVNFESTEKAILALPRIGDDPRLLFIDNLGIETFVYAAVKP